MKLTALQRREKNAKIAARKELAGYTTDIEACKNCDFYKAPLKNTVAPVGFPFCLKPENLFNVEPQAICDLYVPKTGT